MNMLIAVGCRDAAQHDALHSGDSLKFGRQKLVFAHTILLGGRQCHGPATTRKEALLLGRLVLRRGGGGSSAAASIKRRRRVVVRMGHSRARKYCCSSSTKCKQATKLKLKQRASELLGPILQRATVARNRATPTVRLPS